MRRSSFVRAATEFAEAQARSRGDGESATTADMLAGLIVCGDPQIGKILQKANLSTPQQVLKHSKNDPASEVAGFDSLYVQMWERADHAAEYLQLDELSTGCVLFAITCLKDCIAHTILGNLAKTLRRNHLPQFQNVPEPAMT